MDKKKKKDAFPFVVINSMAGDILEGNAHECVWGGGVPPEVECLGGKILLHQPLSVPSTLLGLQIVL